MLDSALFLYPEIQEELLDFYLTPKEFADLLNITVQGLHKICKENKIVTKKGSSKVHKLYPEQIIDILKIKNINYELMQRIITFHSVKGGPGKTTLVYLLATRLSAIGYKVLMIDLDKQANLTNALGIDDESELILTMLNLFQGYQHQSRNDSDKVDIKKSLIKLTQFLHLIPASIELANFDLALASGFPNLGTLYRSLIKDIVKDYNFILIDLPPDFNRTTVAAHCLANLVYMPVNANAFSAKGVRLTYDHINYVNSEFKRDGASIKKQIIMNKVDAREKATVNTISKLNETYPKNDICEIPIPICKPLEDSFDEDDRKNVWKTARVKPVVASIDALVYDLAELDRWDLKKLDHSKKNSRSSSQKEEVTQNV